MLKITLKCVTCNKAGSFKTKEEDRFSIGGILELTCKGACNGLTTAHRIDNIEYVYSENQ